jgi:hypothetical protein
MGNDINTSKLIGGKRKNGHKSNCSCHICENMKNKAQRGGYEEELEKEVENKMGGSKKKNGHRKTCKCPICKNMKNASRRTRKNKRGGGDDDEEEPEEQVDESEEEPEEQEKPEEETMEGGRKKRNGHKANCKCPICKNMRKKRGGTEPEPQSNGSYNRTHDIAMQHTQEDESFPLDESFFNSESTPTQSSDSRREVATTAGGRKRKNKGKRGGDGENEENKTEQNGILTKATDEDYDELDNVGGTRKRRGGKRKRIRKTRRHRRH